MGGPNIPLNPAQLEVLAWVRDGCTDGIYTGWSHRITARALHNRGLVTVQGHGPAWKASLTDAGAAYLDTEERPPAAPTPQAGSPNPVGAAECESSRTTSAPPRTPKSKQPQTTKPLRPVDQLMAALRDADGNLILIAPSEQRRYRQLVSSAKRSGRIPDGMQITVEWRQSNEYVVVLAPRPAWEVRVLDPLPVPSRLHDPSDVTTALSESETFQVAGPPRKRALRLVEALVSAARQREMTVRAVLNQPLRPEYGSRSGPRRDEIEFAIGEDRYRLWFTQATLREPHQATPREIARVQYGYLFPDFDDVPATHLGLVLNGDGGKFWASDWRDTDEHLLEQDLAQVLEEIKLRHEQLVERRAAEQARAIARQEREREARVIAAEKYREQFVVNAMKAQAARWEEATLLRRYASAIRETATLLSPAEASEALAWALRVEAEANAKDPLPDAARLPIIPEPSYGDISKFL